MTWLAERRITQRRSKLDICNSAGKYAAGAEVARWIKRKHDIGCLDDDPRFAPNRTGGTGDPNGSGGMFQFGKAKGGVFATDRRRHDRRPVEAA
jgi:hypothetical protein